MNGGSELVSWGSLRGLPYLLLQTVFSYDVPFCHNTKSQTTTDARLHAVTMVRPLQSTVGQKPGDLFFLDYSVW